MQAGSGRFGSDIHSLSEVFCVEIMSPANTEAEMMMKVRLYLEAGAEEVWIVQLDGIRVVHR